jgi:hypothetical protein
MKVYDYVRKSLLLVSSRDHMNSVHTFSPCSIKIYFNIIFPSHLGLLSGPFASGFVAKALCISHLSHAC